MNQKVRIGQLLQRCPEGVYQMVGQLGDESHRVRQDDPQRVIHLQLPGGGVQGVKEAVVGRNARAGEPVQQRGLACIGVAHQRHHRNGVFHPLAALHRPNLADLGQLLLQLGNSGPDVATIRLQLGLTRAPGANAAALPGQADSHTGQAGKQIFVLSQLHLEPSLCGLGPLGKDVQNQGAAVQNRYAQELLQHPNLGGR